MILKTLAKTDWEKRRSIYKNKTFTVRLTEEELDNIRQRASIYAANNLSAWVLYAAQNCRPKADDLYDE